MRNKYIESRPWLLGWIRFLKSRHLHISSLHIDWSTHKVSKERSPKNIWKDFQNLGFLGLAILRYTCSLVMESLLISTFPIWNFSPIMQKESLFHPSADLQFRFMPCACGGRYHLFQQTDEIFVTYKDMFWRAIRVRALLYCCTAWHISWHLSKTNLCYHHLFSCFEEVDWS